MLYRLMQVMMELDRESPLGGRVEFDDAYLDGRRSGDKCGHGTPSKKLVAPKFHRLVLVAVIVLVTSHTTYGGVVCKLGESVCGNHCYNPFTHICYGRTACKLGEFPCGDRCYSPPNGEVCHKTKFNGDYWGGFSGPEINVGRVCETRMERYQFDKLQTICWPGVPCFQDWARFVQWARFYDRPLHPQISTDREWIWERLKKSNKECIPESNLEGYVNYKFTWPSGEQYDGEWLNGQYHGKGTYTFKSGNKYLGEFKYDRAHGYGIYVTNERKKYSVRAVNGCIGLAEWWVANETSERNYMARIGAKPDECPVSR